MLPPVIASTAIGITTASVIARVGVPKRSERFSSSPGRKPPSASAPKMWYAPTSAVFAAKSSSAEAVITTSTRSHGPPIAKASSDCSASGFRPRGSSTLVENAVSSGDVARIATTTSPIAMPAVRRRGVAIAGEICASDSSPLNASHAPEKPITASPSGRRPAVAS